MDVILKDETFSLQFLLLDHHNDVNYRIKNRLFILQKKDIDGKYFPQKIMFNLLKHIFGSHDNMKCYFLINVLAIASAQQVYVNMKRFYHWSNKIKLHVIRSWSGAEVLELAEFEINPSRQEICGYLLF